MRLVPSCIRHDCSSLLTYILLVHGIITNVWKPAITFICLGKVVGAPMNLLEEEYIMSHDKVSFIINLRNRGKSLISEHLSDSL